jgi:thiazole synthase
LPTAIPDLGNASAGIETAKSLAWPLAENQRLFSFCETPSVAACRHRLAHAILHAPSPGCFSHQTLHRQCIRLNTHSREVFLEGITMQDPLVIAGKKFNSRLMVGTGRHRNMEEMVASIEASGTEIITVAIRRLNLDNPAEKNILDYFDWGKYQILPNTAGCKTAEEAIFTAHLAREVTGSNWIKVEVIPEPKHLLPDPIGTFEACKQLVQEGYVVLPYIHADPVLAKRLEDIGCATVMPLGSAIGSGQGILTLEEIRLIIEDAGVPVVVDAGLAVPSEAAQALEVGAQAVLVNTAIAQAKDPALMGEAFKLGVEAGRKAYIAGRIARRQSAIASSPAEGLATSVAGDE